MTTRTWSSSGRGRCRPRLRPRTRLQPPSSRALNSDRRARPARTLIRRSAYGTRGWADRLLANKVDPTCPQPPLGLRHPDPTQGRPAPSYRSFDSQIHLRSLRLRTVDRHRRSHILRLHTISTGEQRTSLSPGDALPSSANHRRLLSCSRWVPPAPVWQDQHLLQSTVSQSRRAPSTGSGASPTSVPRARDCIGCFLTDGPLCHAGLALRNPYRRRQTLEGTHQTLSFSLSPDGV